MTTQPHSEPAREAVAFRPHHMTALLRHAFLSGRGLTGDAKLSDDDVAAWVSYDPTKLPAYHIWEETVLASPAPAASGGLEAKAIAWLRERGGNISYKATIRDIDVALAAVSACPSCKGAGCEADYAGDDMRCVPVSCSACGGSGRAALSAPPATGGAVPAEDSLVLVRRDMLASACAAIRLKKDAPTTLEYLRQVYLAPAHPSAETATGGEPVGYMRVKDNDGGSFWCSRRRGSYYTEPVYTHPSAETGAGVGVKVRELEWTERSPGSWEARALGLIYVVVDSQWWISYANGPANPCASDDEAKAAAQQDYASRILSALASEGRTDG